MRGESSVGIRRLSNRERRKFAPRKIGASQRRIFFRDLAKLAAPRKTAHFLADCTDCDLSTAKRWLSGKSRVGGDAVYAVLAHILTEIRMSSG